MNKAPKPEKNEETLQIEVYEESEVKIEPMEDDFRVINEEEPKPKSKTTKTKPRVRQRATKTKDGTYKCEMQMCRDSDVVFATKTEYLNHKLKVPHYVCKPCDLAFLTLKDRREHQSQKTCKTFICPKCGKNFWSEDPKKLTNRYAKLKVC